MSFIFRENLHGGSQVKGYSHTVCVHIDNIESWKADGYEIIQENEDSFLLGKRKVKRNRQ